METKPSVKKGITLLIPFILSFALPIWFMSFSSYIGDFGLPKEFTIKAVLPMSALSMIPLCIVIIIQKLKTRQL